jgi:c(7)-type cytochrome triheme protein
MRQLNETCSGGVLMKYRLIFSIVAMCLLIQHVAFAVTVRDVVYPTKNLGKVVFSHGDHINKKDMSKNCRACHDAIFDLKTKKHYLMADMEKGKSCGACHDGKKIFGLDKCATCHLVKEITFKVKETGPTHFSHKIHIEGTECATCHPTLYAANQKNRRVGMAAMEKGKSCGACHNSKKAFAIKECSKCHPARELVFEDKDAGNVNFSHKSHTGLYACGDCHKSLYQTTRSKVKVSMQNMEKGKSCGSCHDGKTAFSVATDKDCDKCHKM